MDGVARTQSSNAMASCGVGVSVEATMQRVSATPAMRRRWCRSGRDRHVGVSCGDKTVVEAAVCSSCAALEGGNRFTKDSRFEV